MKVLLIQSVGGLGQKGAILEVSDGYARNFLISKGLAVPADSPISKKIIAEIQDQAQAKRKQRSRLEDLLTRLQSHKFVFEKPATEDGKLYAQVTPEEIALQIANVFQLPGLDQKKVKLISPIKHTGTHKVEFSNAGKKVLIKLEVKSQKPKNQ